MAQFVFHIDPAHGWLEVSATDLKELGMKCTDFTRFSRFQPQQDGSMRVFLEEDCDAPRFLAAYRKVKGIEPQYEESYTNHSSFVRALNPLRMERT